jgi:hypothetical protein
VCHAEQRLTAPTIVYKSEQCVNSARTARAESEQHQKAHRTVNSTCPVHRRTVRWPHMSELQWSNPNGWVTWLAHRTVRCALRQQPLPTATLVVRAINTLQPPHFKASKFSSNTFNTRALDFTPRHKSKDQILSKSQTHSKDLVACERDICVHLSSCRLDRFSSSPFLVPKTFVIKARDTNCVVVLVGTKCPN